MTGIPDFSIITPVYNGENYIRETIDSVLKYTAALNIEYLIINDGSTDKTLELLQEYSNHHNVRIISQVNSGESLSVNVGIREAAAALMLVVSHDDPLFTEELFIGIKNEFAATPNLAAIYSDWRIINSTGDIVIEKFVKDYSDELLIGAFNCLPGPGTIFRRDLALKVGGRDPRWKFVGDYDFWLRLSRVGTLKHRAKMVAQWRSHDESTSVGQRGAAMALERISVIEDFLAQNEVSNSLRRKALGACYVFAAQLSFFSEYVPGKKYLLNAFIKRRGWPEQAKIKVVTYILLLPLSRSLYSFVTRSLKGGST
jgi:glycosyltransferase involved in cell wall biosynthesis